MIENGQKERWFGSLGEERDQKRLPRWHILGNDSIECPGDTAQVFLLLRKNFTLKDKVRMFCQAEKRRMAVQAEHEDTRWVCGKHQVCALTCGGNEVGEAVRRLVVRSSILYLTAHPMVQKTCLSDCLKARLWHAGIYGERLRRTWSMEGSGRCQGGISEMFF